MTLNFIRASLHYFLGLFIVALLSFVGPVSGGSCGEHHRKRHLQPKERHHSRQHGYGDGGLCGGKRRGYHHVDGGRRN